MDKAKLNFVIDSLMFLFLAAIAGLGFLMKYVLLPGREAALTYGRRVDLFLFGLDRHDWGTIHLYLGFLFLALLALHLVLHWHMIPGLFARLVPDSRKRAFIAWVYAALAAALLLFPFFIGPELKEGDGGPRRGYGALGQAGGHTPGYRGGPPGP